MKSRLLQQNSIAGAVAREIIRAEQFAFDHGRHGRTEGVAYKAEWDRRGSDALKHCRAFGVDCATMEIGCREGARELIDFMVTP